MNELNVFTLDFVQSYEAVVTQSTKVPLTLCFGIIRTSRRAVQLFLHSLKLFHPDRLARSRKHQPSKQRAVLVGSFRPPRQGFEYRSSCILLSEADP